MNFRKNIRYEIGKCIISAYMQNYTALNIDEFGLARNSIGGTVKAYSIISKPALRLASQRTKNYSVILASTIFSNFYMVISGPVDTYVYCHFLNELKKVLDRKYQN